MLQNVMPGGGEIRVWKTYLLMYHYARMTEVYQAFAVDHLTFQHEVYDGEERGICPPSLKEVPSLSDCLEELECQEGLASFGLSAEHDDTRLRDEATDKPVHVGAR